jgi:hypothetical protein
MNFHTEHPASEDVFPGGSHEKVANAMGAYILSPNSSKVIGLDGEFGSGKSSILNMLKSRLLDGHPDYRVWFFDCEQNYQGSTKSNFIELFTQEVLKDVPVGSADEKKMKTSRDVALGRQFTYRKKTTSRVSAWALALLVSLFFSSASFKELFTLSQKDELNWLLVAIHIVTFISPALVLMAAWWRNRDEMEGGEKWSLLSLFKGSTDDYINEKIEVSKEVTPLDLKRTLTSQLHVVANQKYVVIIDNLDRLPKDNLRAVWSDLEIFTSVAEAENLIIIVPFCSTKIANYLGSDRDGKYDSKDFIAKKFPIVFRAPPVIASGWKDGFLRLWRHTFGDADLSSAEYCCQLLQRHSPMVNKLVTPRLQKKFINDIATTSLVIGETTSLLAIAAHLLLCKYNEYPLSEIMRVDGFSALYAQEVGDEASVQIKETNKLLNSNLGSGMDTGWQIQFLQIHFLTSSEYAIAELLDKPLEDAFASRDGEKLFELTSLFGFADAFKRFVTTDTGAAAFTAILPTIQDAHLKHGGTWIEQLVSMLNVGDPIILSKQNPAELNFYDSVKYCVEYGLAKQLFAPHGDALRSALLDRLNATYDADNIARARDLLKRLDNYLDALGIPFSPVVLDSAEALMHLIEDVELKVIKPGLFTLSDKALKGAHRQIASCEDYSLDMTPLSPSLVAQALIWLYAHRKLSTGIGAGIDIAEVTALSKFCGPAGEEAAAVVGLALSDKIDAGILSTVSSLIANSGTPTVKAVAAVVYIRQHDAESLSTLEGLEEVIETPLFRALGIATLTSDALFKMLQSGTVDAIAKYLAYLILEKKIHSFSHAWVLRNFGTLADLVGEYGVDENGILTWLCAWDLRFENVGQHFGDLDGRLIEQVFSDSSCYLPTLKKSVFAFLASPERTQEEWSGMALDAKPLYKTVIRSFASAGEVIQTAMVLKAALLKLLSDAATGEPGSELTPPRVATIHALKTLLDAELMDIIGIHLRTLIFSENASPQNLGVIVGEYGALIPEVQPSNSMEAGRLIEVLDYISRDPVTTSALATFFDSKAEQIAAYKFSPDMRKSMGRVVAKLRDRTPALYARFAETRGFIGILKDLGQRKHHDGE